MLLRRENDTGTQPKVLVIKVAKMSKLGVQGGQVGHVEEAVDFSGFG